MLVYVEEFGFLIKAMEIASFIEKNWKVKMIIQWGKGINLICS